MLSLNSLKTTTIYSKYQINSLHHEFKVRLNEAYAQQSSQKIENCLMMIKLLYYLSEIPSLLKQLNQLGQIQILSTLQILFMKSSQWKSHKQVMQKWISLLMKKICQFVSNYQIKQQISTVEFPSTQQLNSIQFFSLYLQKISKQRILQAMTVSICFLRVFLIDQIQNKKKQFKLSQGDKISPQWKIINQNLIKICQQLQNLKLEQICISILYWLCSQNKQFMYQCVINGIISFLCQTLSNKNVSEWYGKKILSFLKLLLLNLDGKKQYSSTDIELCIAQFTLQHDNQIILQQARSLFTCMKNSQNKISIQKQSYERFIKQKNPKNLQKCMKDFRVLLLYSEDQIIKQELSDPQNLQYLYKTGKKQQNIFILSQIYNIIAYNTFERNKNSKYDHDIMIIQRVGDLLTNSVYKNDFVSNNKKVLITLIRMFKQMIQNRQFQESIIEKIKSQSISKKFGKYADFNNFQYQRQLLSLIRMINNPHKNKQDLSKESLQLLKNFVIFLNDNNNKKFGKKRLEDQLQQIEIIHQLIQRGQGQNIKPEIISNLFKKIHLQKDDKLKVQIAILDQSQQQKSRQLINKINHLSISSLVKVQKEQKLIQYSLNQEDIDKVIKLGLISEDLQTLKAATQYLITLSQKQKLPSKFKERFDQVYRRYKERFGDQSELIYSSKKNTYINTISQEQEIQQKKPNLNKIAQVVDKSFSNSLSSQQKSLLQTILFQQDISNLKLCLQKFAAYIKSNKQLTDQSLHYLLRLLIKACRIDDLNRFVFQTFSLFLSQRIHKTEDANQNLIFKVYLLLMFDNIKQNKQFFSQQLEKSYQFFSHNSIEFTSSCLAHLQYKSSNQRLSKYWRYIYNSPEMISRQAAFVISNKQQNQTKNQQPEKNSNKSAQQSHSSDKFWSIFQRHIQKNIEQERKLTLQFLEMYGQMMNKLIWQKYKLNIILQKLIQKLKSRQLQIHSKTPTQPLLKRLIRLSKAIQALISNENLDISSNINTFYQEITNYLITHPKLNSNAKRLNQLNEQYIKFLLLNLKSIYKRRDGFSSVRKQLKIYQQITRNVSEYNNKQMNNQLLQIYRILMLRDDRHQQFQQVKNMYSQSKQQLIGQTNDKGNAHLQACQRVIEAVTQKNQNTFKKQYIQYFFAEDKQKMKKNEKIQFSDQQLLQHLKNLLNPPYQYGLNTLQPHLRMVKNAQFSNVLISIFNNSGQLFQQDKQNKKKSLDQVQYTIVDSIWGNGIKLGPDFYKMINHNLCGLRVSLKTKGIGMEGVAIVCQKFYQFPEQIPLCAQILHVNVNSNKQWRVIFDKKIPDLVNKTYKQKGRQEKYGLSLANLIGSSAKLKAIQNQYKVSQQLYKNLQFYSKNIPCLAATMHAISGLVYLNDINQKLLAKQQHIRTYLKIIQQNNTSILIFDKGCNLLSNMVYKNTSLINTYLKLGIQKSIIQIACSLLYEYGPYKQYLKLIGNLSLNLQAANSIIKTQFLYLWSNGMREAETNKNQDIIKYSFDIIFNLLNYHEVDAKNIAYKVNQADCVTKIIQYLQRNCLNSSIVQSGLDALDKILLLQVSRKKALSTGLLKCLQDIAKTQLINQAVFQKWIKLFYGISKQQQVVKNHILKSEVFSSLASLVKQNTQIKQQYLNLILVTIDFVYHKGEPSLFVSSGFIDLIVQVMKIKHLKTLNATTIIDYFNSLHQRKILDQSSYTKVFSALMSRLELQFRDQGSKKIINAITKIRDYVVINTKAATILLQFGCIFMTQSETITSQKYKKRVKQFICLLTYFISFSFQLRTIFRGEGFMQILKSWIKIDKSLDQQNQVLEACRMCLFTIQNDQRLFVSVSGVALQNKQKLIQNLTMPTKCLLYRLDHSNKSAIIQLRKKANSPLEMSQYQLVSFKAPDGQIKQKYTVPIRQVIGIRCYQSQEDPLFKQSIFGKSKTIFQKDACATNCITLYGVAGQELSIRLINVQFDSQSIRDSFCNNLKTLISICVKNKAVFVD